MSVDQSWGPTVTTAPRRRGLRRLLRVLVLLLLLTVVVIVVMALWAMTRLDRQPVDGLAATSRPMHVLITGSDSREGLTPEERVELSTGSDEGERTDTIMVMTIDRGRVALLSFPRDLWVTRCDGSSGRINAAVQRGGISCLVTTVRALSGLDIHHHIGLTFGGFRDVVDAVGGVQLCLDEPISDRDAGIDLPAGCQVLDGADALGFVRVRKIDDDFARMERQQEFLTALAREISAPSTLLNPVRLTRLINDSGQAVSVDRRLGPIDLARIAWGLRGLADGTAATSTVPGTPRITSGGAWVLDVSQPEADALFARFASGSVLAETAATGLPEPDEIRVRVLNGSGVSGLAGRTADALGAGGYEVAEIGNAEPTERTVVRHPPGRQAAAERLSLDVPGRPALEESTSVDQVTLVLGRDQGG